MFMTITCTLLYIYTNSKHLMLSFCLIKFHIGCRHWLCSTICDTYGSNKYIMFCCMLHLLQKQRYFFPLHVTFVTERDIFYLIACTIYCTNIYSVQLHVIPVAQRYILFNCISIYCTNKYILFDTCCWNRYILFNCKWYLLHKTIYSI